MACSDVARLGPQDDRCAFVREHCTDTAGLLNYPRLYYCGAGRHGALLAALMVVSMLACRGWAAAVAWAAAGGRDSPTGIPQPPLGRRGWGGACAPAVLYLTSACRLGMLGLPSCLSCMCCIWLLVPPLLPRWALHGPPPSPPASQSACALLLVLLFRIIARASDDYFSCILSQISQDLGLPPRLGGVTLLALGNGAPDLSASIEAVKTGAPAWPARCMWAWWGDDHEDWQRSV